MRQRLSLKLARTKRLAARKARAVNDAPPDATTKLRAAVRQLRETANDPATLDICSEAEKLIASGWIERRGPFEPRPAKPLPEWKKPPPENP